MCQLHLPRGKNKIKQKEERAEGKNMLLEKT